MRRRDQQCNLLIDEINAHTPKMSAATEGFAEITTNPSVVGEYEDVVQTAIDAVDGLEIEDENVRGFAGRYLVLLRSAKKVGGHMRDAAKDASLLPGVVTEADEIRTTEEKLVSDVNAYCSPDIPRQSIKTP